MGRLCYSLLGVKWKMCWGTRWATSVGLRRPIAERPREMVRKLSPYDVFPPSQRRFRRDTRGSQESYDSVGVMENRGGKQWESGPRREREREAGDRVCGGRRRAWEALSLLLRNLSACDIMLIKGTSRADAWMNMRKLTAPFLNKMSLRYLTDISLSRTIVVPGAECLHKNNYPLPEFINVSICP